MKHTTETKRKISDSMKGKTQTAEHVQLRQAKRKETLQKKLQEKLARR